MIQKPFFPKMFISDLKVSEPVEVTQRRDLITAFVALSEYVDVTVIAQAVAMLAQKIAPLVEVKK